MNSKSLSYRLFGSYLLITATLLGIFSLAMYRFFARSLYHDLDQQLVVLANTAVLNSSKLKQQPQSDIRHTSVWHETIARGLSLQWFDANGRLLMTQGAKGSSSPPQVSGKVESRRGFRELTVAIPTSSASSSEPLLGYVRVSKSTLAVDEILAQLRWQLLIGLLIELGLCGLGGLWLTRQAVLPVERSLVQVQQFTADASHELRSPLTVIKSNIGLVLNHPERIHAADTKRLTAINWAADQMLILIEDLLFLARTDQVQPELAQVKTPVDLTGLLRSLVVLFEPQAQAKGITLQSELSSGLHLLGNIAQLNRLFANLVENAIQYTQADGQIWVRGQRQGKQIQVEVQDTGIGIAPEDIDKVFDRFWQADQARTYHAGGYGLGLAIARAVVTQHEGKLQVKSELGQGTTFTVHLPAI